MLSHESATSSRLTDAGRLLIGIPSGGADAVVVLLCSCRSITGGSCRPGQGLPGARSEVQSQIFAENLGQPLSEYKSRDSLWQELQVLLTKA